MMRLKQQQYYAIRKRQTDAKRKYATMEREREAKKKRRLKKDMSDKQKK